MNLDEWRAEMDFALDEVNQLLTMVPPGAAVTVNCDQAPCDGLPPVYCLMVTATKR